MDINIVHTLKEKISFFNNRIQNESTLITNMTFNLEKDQHYIRNGNKMRKTKKVIFVSLARNIQNTVTKNLYIFKQIGRLFNDYRIVVVEDSSTDDTVDILNKWYDADKKHNILITLTPEEVKLFEYNKNRLPKMAYIRNKYLKYVKENYSLFDFMIVIDLDLIMNIYLQNIYQSIGYLNNKNIDCITANGVDKRTNTYYDVFAYDPYYKFWHNRFNQIFCDLHLPLYTSKLIKVKSAFGGLAVYKIKSLIKQNSDYNYTCDNDYCEHTNVNKNINVYYDTNLLLDVYSF